MGGYSEPEDLDIRALTEDETKEALNQVAVGKVPYLDVNGDAAWANVSDLTISPGKKGGTTIQLPSPMSGGSHHTISSGSIGASDPYMQSLPPTFDQAMEVFRTTYQHGDMALGLHANIAMMAQDAGANARESNYWAREFLMNWLKLDYEKFGWWADYAYSPAVRMVSRIELRGKCEEIFGERIATMEPYQLFKLIGALGETIAMMLGNDPIVWSEMDGLVGSIILEIPDGLDWHEEVLELCWSQACKSRIDRIDRGRSVTIGGVIDAIE
jgi:hypothetical protein